MPRHPWELTKTRYCPQTTTSSDKFSDELYDAWGGRPMLYLCIVVLIGYMIAGLVQGFASLQDHYYFNQHFGTYGFTEQSRQEVQPQVVETISALSNNYWATLRAAKTNREYLIQEINTLELSDKTEDQIALLGNDQNLLSHVMDPVDHAKKGFERLCKAIFRVGFKDEAEAVGYECD